MHCLNLNINLSHRLSRVGGGRIGGVVVGDKRTCGHLSTTHLSAHLILYISAYWRTHTLTLTLTHTYTQFLTSLTLLTPIHTDIKAPRHVFFAFFCMDLKNIRGKGRNWDWDLRHLNILWQEASSRNIGSFMSPSSLLLWATALETQIQHKRCGWFSYKASNAYVHWSCVC